MNNCEEIRHLSQAIAYTKMAIFTLDSVIESLGRMRELSFLDIARNNRASLQNAQMLLETKLFTLLEASEGK